MKRFDLQYKPYGESAILMQWPNEVSKTVLNDIRIFTENLRLSGITGITDFNFVYSSLLVSYDHTVMFEVDLIKLLKELYNEEKSAELSNRDIWYIPVCYDLVFGLDLEEMSIDKQLKIEKLIELHRAPFYTVYGVGFLPGFLYLGGLNKELATVRKEIPRLDVFEGAVAIGGNQTGIYPQNSPGGWNIIGKTPIPLFDSKKEDPTFIKPGDQIKFYAVSKSKFDIIEIELEAGVYDFKKVVND